MSFDTLRARPPHASNISESLAPVTFGEPMEFQSFALSAVFDTVATAIPDQTFIVWHDMRLTYREVNDRATAFAGYLSGLGLGLHEDRDTLAGHQCGQDTLGIYLRNGNHYVEAMLGSYRARVAPFNVNYRYTDDELFYVLNDAATAALVYAAEFAPQVAALRDRLPSLRVLIQVDDGSPNGLLSGAVDFDQIASIPPAFPLPEPSGDDLYVLYTGGTTGMPKGVLWRQHDIFMAAMGGTRFGVSEGFTSYEQIAAAVSTAPGALSLMIVPPLMHGAAQWAVFNTITSGGYVVFPDTVNKMDAAEVLRLVERERVVALPVIGDAMARPLVEEIERTSYDLSGLMLVNNGSAVLSPPIKARLLNAVPHVILGDSFGSSETGVQAHQQMAKGSPTDAQSFQPSDTVCMLDDNLTRRLDTHETTEGWIAQAGRAPLGYLGDEAKTEKTFPTINGTRYAVPGDRGHYDDDGKIVLLGRDATAINSGGEKVFAEEVERAMAAHPDIADVIVVGRPDDRWGNAVVALVCLRDSSHATDDELVAVAAQRLARYKLPKAIVRCDHLVRSPSGKPDYRWARQRALSPSM
jgi:acyl-CoA synthetase (AMP-forming)/AMP-acid ligase II